LLSCPESGRELCEKCNLRDFVPTSARTSIVSLPVFGGSEPQAPLGDAQRPASGSTRKPAGIPESHPLSLLRRNATPSVRRRGRAVTAAAGATRGTLHRGLRLRSMPRTSSSLSGTSAGQYAIAHAPAMTSASTPRPAMVSLPVTMANQKSAKNRTRQTMIVIPAQAGRWPKVDGAGARINLLTRRGPPAFPYEDPTCPQRPHAARVGGRGGVESGTTPTHPPVARTLAAGFALPIRGDASTRRGIHASSADDQYAPRRAREYQRRSDPLHRGVLFLCPDVHLLRRRLPCPGHGLTAPLAMYACDVSVGATS
jgi:hypothetical protein